MLSRKVANTNSTVFGLTGLELNPLSITLKVNILIITPLPKIILKYFMTASAGVYYMIAENLQFLTSIGLLFGNRYGLNPQNQLQLLLNSVSGFIVLKAQKDWSSGI